MFSQSVVRSYRAFFGLLTLAAIWYQFTENSQRDVWNPVNFFSFFTIQSNVIAAVVLLIGALAAKEQTSLAWALVRGAATMYMVTTGVVYALLLSGLEESLQTPTLWVNIVLHQVLPIVMVVDFIIRPIEGHRLAMRQALSWLVYPLLYLAYTLVRGAEVDWYPYPFLDPRDSGYGTVAIYCAVILLGFVAVSSLVVVLTHHTSAERGAASSPG